METALTFPTQRAPLGGVAWLVASLGLVWVSMIATGWSFGQALPWIGWLAAISAMGAAYHMGALLLRQPRIVLARTHLQIVTAHGAQMIALQDIARIRRNTLSGAQIGRGALGHDPATATADLVEITHTSGRILLRADQFQHLTDFDSFLDTLEARAGHQATPYSE